MPGGKGKEGLQVTFAATTQKMVTNKKAVAVYGLLRLILKKNLIGNSSSTRQNMRLACVLGIVQLVKWVRKTTTIMLCNKPTISAHVAPLKKWKVLTCCTWTIKKMYLWESYQIWKLKNVDVRKRKSPSFWKWNVTKNSTFIIEKMKRNSCLQKLLPLFFHHYLKTICKKKRILNNHKKTFVSYIFRKKIYWKKSKEKLFEVFFLPNFPNWWPNESQIVYYLVAVNTLPL